MAVRTSEAEWRGNLRDGQGTMIVGSGVFEGAYSYASRFEEGKGTNPEELIGAAHAGCFSMALAGGLANDGYKPQRIHTTAKVHLNRVNGGFEITRIDLHMLAEVPEIDGMAFQRYAEAAKETCPVSKALRGVPEVTLEAKLV